MESKINYGETFKNIRKNKKLNQEEVCFGIITRTALSKFENGKNSITLGHFISLLNRIDISLEEFMFINNEYDYNDFFNIIHDFFSLTSNFEIELIHSIIQHCNEYLNKEHNWYISSIKEICIGFNHFREVSYEVVKQTSKDFAFKIWEDISAKDEWYYLDLRLINNLIFIFPTDVITYIVSELDNKFQKYSKFTNYNILNLSLKLNMSIILIKENKHLIALKLLNESLLLSKNARRYDFYVFSLARIGIIEKNEDLLNQVLKLSELIDIELYGALVSEIKELKIQ